MIQKRMLTALMAIMVIGTAIGSPPRGRSCWAFRCVLDTKPRILVLALAPNVWAAYDTPTGHLWKVWSGGIKFDGTIYTTKHGPQPTTRGDMLQEDDNNSQQPWVILKAGQSIPFTIQYKGHKLEGGQTIILTTQLIIKDGPTIIVEERPEVIAAKIGAKNKAINCQSLVRQISLKSNASIADYEIKQYFNSGAQQQEDDISIVGGTLAKLSRKEYYHEGSTQYGYAGWLTLSNAATTTITHRYPNLQP